MKDYDCSGYPLRTSWSCQMKNHHDLPKEQKVFNCANAIEPLKCFQCTNFVTHNLAHLRRHLKSHHTLLKFEMEIYDCENCSFQTYSNYLFLRHKLLKLCGEYKKIKSKALKGNQKSLVQKNNFKVFQCGCCSYRTTFSRDIQRHILVKHTDPKKIQWFYCGDCSYKGKTKQRFKEHIKRMHNLEYFKCEHCSFKTKDKRNLKCHNLSKHAKGAEIEWFECAQCPFKAETLYVLRQHLDEKHDNTKGLKCDKCPFETDYKQALRQHIFWKHADREKNQWFQCKQCSYKSSRKFNLKQHMVCRHSGKKRFKCDQCPFRTAHNNSLQGHILRKHSEDAAEETERFQYPQNSYKTDVTSTVKCHTISKNSEPEKIKWFQCDHCSYKYTVEAYLKRHVECTHGKVQT